MSIPTFDQAISLRASFDQAVTEEFIDENGHMNIVDYFKFCSWAPWLRLGEIGMGEHYIAERGLSFFTVEHHISYASELRLGERFTVHSGFVGRAARALHGVGIVVDREHDRVACVLEVMYVHISMADRRAAPIPDDLAAAIDAEMASYGSDWLPNVVDHLTFRRT